MDASNFYAQQATWAVTPEMQARTLDNPVRRHEPDGIGHIASNPQVPASRVSEAASLALEFIDDLCSPEAYGHALPTEVVARAGRIRAMLKPKPAVCERPTGIGYMQPYPARCEACDSE